MLNRAARRASLSRHISPPRVVIADAVLIPQARLISQVRLAGDLGALYARDLGGPVCTRRRMPRIGATHKYY